MRRVAHVLASEHGVGEPPDRHDVAIRRQTLEEWPRRLDLDARGTTVRLRPTRGVRMSRHDVPEERLVLEPERGEHAVDDRRRRLSRPSARDLVLGGQRHAAHPRAAVAGSLGDEQKRRFCLRLEVVAQALAPNRRTLAVAIEVERRPDRRGGELVDEGHGRSPLTDTVGGLQPPGRATYKTGATTITAAPRASAITPNASSA